MVNTNFSVGYQTDMAVNNFSVGMDFMPEQIIKALAIIKICASKANYRLGTISQEKQQLIENVALDILNNNISIAKYFPLKVWQSGSGTQTNMNINEVIANIVNSKNNKIALHPNDDVNKSQSSNDSFSSAMHIAIYNDIFLKLIPALKSISKTLKKKSNQFKKITKVGRTHLQDATPIKLGDEFACYLSQIDYQIDQMSKAIKSVLYIPQGGTAVGNGISCPNGFAECFIEELCKITGYKFKQMQNKYFGISTHDIIATINGNLCCIATSLTKIANDIRFLSCGPRAGISEIILPPNEPGSSIMPGKVNPTQCESVLMVCAQVMGNCTSVNIGCMGGQLQLNTYKPLIANNVLNSINLLSDVINNFNSRCVLNIKCNKYRIQQMLDSSLMVVTALNSYIGYDAAAKVALYAHQNNKNIEEALKHFNLDSAQNLSVIRLTKNGGIASKLA